MRNTLRPCTDLPPRHRHCIHGHTEDCPNPEERDLLPVDTPTSGE